MSLNINNVNRINKRFLNKIKCLALKINKKLIVNLKNKLKFSVEYLINKTI